jgi:hypothetical protein
MPIRGVYNQLGQPNILLPFVFNNIPALLCQKKKDRSGDVYENKGPVFHRRGQTVNVIENKRSYALNAGMV